MAIRAVFFDAGNTLVYSLAMRTERFAYLCRGAGIPLPDDPQRVLAGAIAQDRFLQRRRRHPDWPGKSWWIQLNRAGLEAAGIDGDLDEMSARILQWAKANPTGYQSDPEAVPLLTDLRSRGFRLAVISNWDGSLVDTFRQIGLGGYFEAMPTWWEPGPPACAG